MKENIFPHRIRFYHQGYSVRFVSIVPMIFGHFYLAQMAIVSFYRIHFHSKLIAMFIYTWPNASHDVESHIRHSTLRCDSSNEQLNNKLQVDIIYIDLRKAFDCIDHQILAMKLCRMSTPLHLFKTIMNFIANREYLLKIDNVITTDTFKANSGIPQGSIIGPLLFNIYINDLPNSITDIATLCLLFCDDTKIMRPIKNINDSFQLQNQLNNILEWCEVNKMGINDKKSYHLSITKFRRKEINTYYFIDNSLINKVTHYKDLGITYD